MAILAFMPSVWFFILVMISFVLILISEGEGSSAVDLSTETLLVAGVMVRWGIMLRYSQFWLDGTTLIQRRVKGFRRCDLAKAEIDTDLGAAPWRSRIRIPRLIARPPGGRPMVLRLREPARGNTMLPPAQLHALADAIIRGRIDDQQVHAVADKLRQMASEPFGRT